MKKQELKRLRSLKNEIQQDYFRLNNLSSEKECDEVLQNFNLDYKKGLEKQMEGYKTFLYAQMQIHLMEYKHLSRCLERINDSLVRQILLCRYIDGMSWTQVALQVGGGNTADSVRKIAERYLV